MRYYNSYLFEDKSLEATTVTPKVDCLSLDVGSFTAVIFDAGDPIEVDLQLEISDAPPSASTTWEPPEESWFPSGETVTLTSNGGQLLKFDGFIGARWARLKATRNTGTGGKILVCCFLKGLGS